MWSGIRCTYLGVAVASDSNSSSASEQLLVSSSDSEKLRVGNFLFRPCPPPGTTHFFWPSGTQELGFELERLLAILSPSGYVTTVFQHLSTASSLGQFIFIHIERWETQLPKGASWLHACAVLHSKKKKNYSESWRSNFTSSNGAHSLISFSSDNSMILFTSDGIYLTASMYRTWEELRPQLEID